MHIQASENTFYFVPLRKSGYGTIVFKARAVQRRLTRLFVLRIFGVLFTLAF